MHALFSVTDIVLNLCITTISLKSLHSIQSWAQRRIVQFLILCMPGITLGLGLLCLYHLIDHHCKAVSRWDSIAGVLLPGLTVIITCAAILTGITRHFLLLFSLFHTKKTGTPQLQQVSNLLAQQFHIPPPPLFCTPLDRPLAFTSGFRRPIIILSSWMLQHLDPQEIEAILAHEMSHIDHHDYLIAALTTVLRDAFFYLPPIQIAYQQLQQEKELRGDEQAIHITQQPLALASALTKVWLYTVEGSAAFNSGQHLVTNRTAIQNRVELLLQTDAHNIHRYQRSMKPALLFCIVCLTLFIIIYLIQIYIFNAFMLFTHCLPLLLEICIP